MKAPWPRPIRVLEIGNAQDEPRRGNLCRGGVTKRKLGNEEKQSAISSLLKETQIAHRSARSVMNPNPEAVTQISSRLEGGPIIAVISSKSSDSFSTSASVNASSF